MRSSTEIKLERAFGGEIPPWLLDATNSKLTVCIQAENKSSGRPITLDDVCRYYAYEAPNITSGCRTIAGIVGDWRPIDNLAKECLEIFKVLNIEGLRKACKSYSDIMTPKF